MKPIISILALTLISLSSCRDRAAEEQRQKEIKAAEAFDRQRDKAMEEATKGEFPTPKPAGPIPD